MASFKDCFTRESHNNAIKLDIVLPNGQEGEYLMLAGTESDAYRSNYKSRFNDLVSVLRDSKEPTKEAKDKEDDFKFELVVGAVVSWSFEEECTFENVALLFREAPYIYDQTKQLLFDVNNFIKKK